MTPANADPKPGRLIFVRHAMPVVRPRVDPRQWELDDRAREDCVLLAHSLRDLRQPALYSSPEPKARQTADVLGLRLGAWPVDDDSFREVGRPTAWVADHATLVADYLTGHPPHGWEHPADALRRFRAGLRRVTGSDHSHEAIIVTHGVALTLYFESLGVDPVPFWRSLAFPSAFLVDTDASTLVSIFPVPMADDPTSARILSG